METLTAMRISLEIDCRDECKGMSKPLLMQLSDGYEVCSVLSMPQSVEAWRDDHRTSRKRSDRATRLGYQFQEIAREDYGGDIFIINTSKDERQGRPMSRGYREEQNFMPLREYPCERHAIRTYGVVDVRGSLVAYLWLYRMGELALVSSILGHGDYMDDGIMHLLFQGAVERQAELGGYFVYNRHDSGTPGLRQFKGWLGFEAAEVQWAL